MKRFFKGHIILGSMRARMNDEFIDHANTTLQVRPSSLRWFCGAHDLEYTFICQAL